MKLKTPSRYRLGLTWLWLAATAVACTPPATQPPPNTPEAARPASPPEVAAPAVEETTAAAASPQSESHGAGGAPDEHHASESAAHAHTDSVSTQDPVAEERAAYERARPVFETYCASCHTSRGKKSSAASLTHFDMASYPFGGHHAEQITATIRKVLGAAGSKATMPKNHPGAVQGDDLALILAWAGAFDRAHPGAAPHGHDHRDEHSQGHH